MRTQHANDKRHQKMRRHTPDRNLLWYRGHKQRPCECTKHNPEIRSGKQPEYRRPTERRGRAGTG
ncbi:hypothetical protein BvCmsF14A_04493 [Escherichia coli]|nr:hypothetical protein BvCmsF14A_04493 [Escherichia coli]